jgi:hypothetical protein
MDWLLGGGEQMYLVLVTIMYKIAKVWSFDPEIHYYFPWSQIWCAAISSKQ